MTELMHRLSAARPTDQELEVLWSAEDRADLLRRIRHTEDPAVRLTGHRRGARAAVVLVAAAAVGLVVLPDALDAPDAVAADLRALALGAVSYDAPVLREGSWLHERSRSVQRNSPVHSDGEVYRIERETWTRWDGRLLLVEHRPLQGWTSYDVIDEPTEPASYQVPSPRFAATLPDDADALLDYLEPRVFGSSSHEEALFDALTGLATSHTLPPRTLAATFEAMVSVDGASTSDVVVQGRPAVEVGFDDEVTSSTETIVVDRATGQVLSVRDRSWKSNYTSTTTLSEVVPEVPPAVLASFRNHREGVRYDGSGAALPD